MPWYPRGVGSSTYAERWVSHLKGVNTLLLVVRVGGGSVRTDHKACAVTACLTTRTGGGNGIFTSQDAARPIFRDELGYVESYKYIQRGYKCPISTP